MLSSLQRAFKQTAHLFVLALGTRPADLKILKQIHAAAFEVDIRYDVSILNPFARVG